MACTPGVNVGSKLSFLVGHCSAFCVGPGTSARRSSDNRRYWRIASIQWFRSFHGTVGEVPGGLGVNVGDKVIKFRGAAGVGDDRNDFKAGVGIPF